ncbi:Protoglobin-domain-containing protein [Sparassis latifolia]
MSSPTSQSGLLDESHHGCPFSGASGNHADHAQPAGKPQATCPAIFTQEVDPILIKHSLEDRIAYLTDFLNFTSADSDVINKVAPHVNDVIPEVVDSMYAKLFEFDITKKVFMKRNQGFDGPLPKRLEDLTLDSPQIVFRKVFMRSWARRVLTSDYASGKTWAYMDKVGLMHTGASPFKHQRSLGITPLNVPYRDCALTLGLVQNILQTAILRLPADKATTEDKIAAVSAINKVIWIQNDLFSRHYIVDE